MSQNHQSAGSAMALACACRECGVLILLLGNVNSNCAGISKLDFIQFQTAATSVRQVLAAVQGFFSC